MRQVFRVPWPAPLLLCGVALAAGPQKAAPPAVPPQSAVRAAAEDDKFAIGKVAPDIEGEDIDGKKFRLSDYRGKVVVIDFWGNW